jgi:hypothetical protein
MSFPPAGSQPSPHVHEPVVDLGSLLGRVSVERFLEAFTRKERLFVKAAHPRRAESLLPRWVGEKLLVSSELPEHRLTLLRDGDVIPRARYRSEDGRVRPESLEALVAEGVSLVVTGIDDELPAIGRLTGALERTLGHTVWCNAYFTHGRGGALAPHYDDHDVLVLQIYGKKRWFLHGSPSPSPIERSPEGQDFGPPLSDLLIESGDVLYLPRGEVHHASVEGELSWHLTFGIDTRRGVDFVASLLERAAHDQAFREDLTRLGGTSAMLEKEAELKARLHALVDRASLASFLDRDDAERPARASSQAPGASPRFGEKSRVFPLIRRTFTLPEGEGPARLRLAGRDLETSRAALEVLATLVAKSSATVTELRGRTPEPERGSLEAHLSELSRLGLIEVESGV